MWLRTGSYRSRSWSLAGHGAPVLLAAPAAQIYELDEEGINSAVYDDLQAVRQMRGFLDAPDRYLRQITIDSETAED